MLSIFHLSKRFFIFSLVTVPVKSIIAKMLFADTLEACGLNQFNSAKPYAERVCDDRYYKRTYFF